MGYQNIQHSIEQVPWAYTCVWVLNLDKIRKGKHGAFYKGRKSISSMDLHTFQANSLSPLQGTINISCQYLHNLKGIVYCCWLIIFWTLIVVGTETNLKLHP